MTTFAVQIGSNGEAHETRPGTLDSAMQPPQSTTEPRQGVRAMDSSERSGRVTIGPNGEMEFTQHGPMRAQTGETNSTDPLELGRDGVWGNRIPRSELKPNSIVKIGGVEGDLAGFERLGLVEKGADGLYRLADAKQQEAQRQQQAEPMAKLSEGGERFFSEAASALGSTTMMAATLSLMEGRELKNAGELASRLRMEPAALSQNIERVTSELTSQARAALQMDESTFAAFTEHVWQHRPNEIRDAILRQVDNGDLRPLRALGAAFTKSGSAYSDEDILSAEFGSGITARRGDDGRVMLNIPGRGTVLAREAFKLGLVKASRA